MSRAVHLGELLAAGNTPSADLSAWLEGVDATLAERLRQESAVRKESLAQFVRVAVSDFIAEADEESWAGLVSALRDAPDPGAACVAYVSAFRLQLETGHECAR